MTKQRWDTLRVASTSHHGYKGCRFCKGSGCLACSGEKARAETGPCIRCGQNVKSPDKMHPCITCLKSLCTPCHDDNERCPDCVDALAEQQASPASDEFMSKLAGAFAAGAKANKFEDDDGRDYPLGVLYRDWLSARDGNQSAYPSRETLEKYQGWAEELLAGGKREKEGAEFRQFSRLRQGNRHMDLMTVWAAVSNGQNCPARIGWEILDEAVTDPINQDELHEAMIAIVQRIDEIKKMDEPADQVFALDSLNAEVQKLEQENRWIMGGSTRRIATARLEAKKKIKPSGVIDEMTGRWDGGVRLGRDDVPSGSLSIIYLESSDTVLWYGDTRHFSRYGEQQFKAAWTWLEEQAANMKRHTIRALHKDFDGDYIHVTRCSEMDEGEMLHKQLFNTYCDPEIPDAWDKPGTHLATVVRSVLQQAHARLMIDAQKEKRDFVFYHELTGMFRELAAEHDLLGLVYRREQVGQLFNPERWIRELGLSVKTKMSYVYVHADKRRLAKKFHGDRIALLQALGEAKSGKRRHTILSQLEDRGWLPIEYRPAKGK